VKFSPGGAAVILLAGAIAASALWVFRSWRFSAELDAKHVLTTEGPFKFVRHPIYLGLCLVLTAVPLLARSWLLAAGVLALSLGYFEAKARTEERKLLERWARARAIDLA